MSEKNGQIGAQWTKSSNQVASASANASGSGSAGATATPIQKHQIFEATAATSGPYGNCGTPRLHGQPDIPYTSGRFQPPPIHGIAPLTIGTAVPGGPHAQSQVSPTVLLTPAPNTTPIHTNVPVSSGFVPPSYSNTHPATGSGVAASAATSVLKPNPFAAAAAAAASGNPNLAFVNAFGFNTAQQLELGKIMNAMNAAGGSIAPATTVAAAAPAAQQLGQRHLGEQVAAGMTAGMAASGSTSGVINSTIAENVMNALVPAQLLPAASGKAADEEKMRRVQHVIESSLDDSAKVEIAQLLERVATLKPIEKLFLYLRLPGESADSDPLRQPQNPLGTRSEINHTINWVRSHLEHDPQVSIPKQDVYNDYIAYCERLSIKPLSTADFGKVMKQVFPGVRPRRLGTRGNSRYCYAAMRKTTKLTPPQLPQLSKSDDAAFAGSGASSTTDQSTSSSLASTAGLELEGDSWSVVRNWAEKLLNTKLDNIKELATRIKANNATIVGGGGVANNAHALSSAGRQMGPKKYSPREPKEKRLLADMGPLKKRRKKKRKGSSSSESSCNQLAPQAQEANSSSQEASAYQLPAVEDEQQPAVKLVQVKQEIMDSPVQQQQQQHHYMALAQQQMLPMNLATEQRTVLVKVSPSPSPTPTPVGVHQLQVRGAVRNLTPKIMELTPGMEQPPVPVPNAAVIIKDEVEDYNTSNIFCKKVLKAQQTKGFLTNSPGTLLVPPTITTTSATPPPPPPVTVQPGTTHLAVPVAVAGSSSPISMGPPAQMNNSSISPSSSLEQTQIVPKVASRNMMLLRAKRIMAAETAAAAEDAGGLLPENLGLPRERVISICNMDKHELDDYFLPDEEENSEGPDTELLQYFQMGDAEEKQMNSLDAAEQKSNRNPQQQQQATQLATMAAPTTTNVVGSASASLTLMSRKHQHQQQQNQHQHHQQKTLDRQQHQLSTTTTITTANLIARSSNNNKRKISLSNSSSNGSNKNCIFLPISPNINANAAPPTSTSTSTSTSAPAAAVAVAVASTCFASPGVTRMRQRSNLLTKQQSLDFDNGDGNADGHGDPMIGAVRRRRNYVYSYPTSTSASAPPSPSVLQQYVGANWSFSGQSNNNNSNVNANANASFNDSNVALLADQNSMDLETSLALATGDMDLQLTPMNETQRSQSVPLSQLQRSMQSPTFNRQLHNASFQAMSTTGNYLAVDQAVGEALFSENSNSQQSVSSALKLNDVNDVAAGLLYEVDVSALISPSFSSKFASIAQQHTQQTATTCSSSAGSSSGYSSGGGGTGSVAHSFGGGIVSRSVPSTPLPHHQQNSFGVSSSNGGGCNGVGGNGYFNLSPSFSWGSAVGANVPYAGHAYGTRGGLGDISKSMPTTPITTPCFRYSPTELHRDFLINGNTIDSLPSSSAFGGAGNDSLGVGTLSTDTLIDDSAPTSVNVVAVEDIIAATDILDSL